MGPCDFKMNAIHDNCSLMILLVLQRELLIWRGINLNFYLTNWNKGCFEYAVLSFYCDELFTCLSISGQTQNGDDE